MKKYYISIDLGATNLRVGLIDDELNIVKVSREPTTKEDKSLLLAQIIRMMDSLSLKDYNIVSIGVSACGFIEHDYIKLLPNLKISDFDLKLHLTNRYNLPVEIKNDANATALSESLFGSSKNYQDSFFVTISSGIGGCLVVDHRLVDLPFEVGHNFINYEGVPTDFESLCSGNGLKKLCANKGLNIEHAGEFFALVKVENDPIALKIYDFWIEQVAVFLANVQLNYNLDCIVLSGGVMKSDVYFMEDLLSKTKSLLTNFPTKPINFVPALFEQDAGLMGGYAVAISI